MWVLPDRGRASRALKLRPVKGGSASESSGQGGATEGGDGSGRFIA